MNDPIHIINEMNDPIQIPFMEKHFSLLEVPDCMLYLTPILSIHFSREMENFHVTLGLEHPTPRRAPVDEPNSLFFRRFGDVSAQLLLVLPRRNS